MHEKKFSILFPTRERPDLLTNILNSIVLHTHDIEAIEILIAYDDDDDQTEAVIRDGIYVEPHIPIQWVRTKRSLNFSRDYYTMLSKRARGRWLIIVNDDAEFETPNWDLMAERALQDQAPVIYGWVEDGLGASRMTDFNDYTCFPILGRAGVEALGYVFPERIPTWGADIFIRYLYGQVGRIVKVPIMIRHLSHHNGLRAQDHINKRIQDNQVPIDMNPTNEEINKLIQAARRTAHV